MIVEQIGWLLLTFQRYFFTKVNREHSLQGYIINFSDPILSVIFLILFILIGIEP